MDARMREVYGPNTPWGKGLVILAARTCKLSYKGPHQREVISIGAGTGWRAYSELGRLYSPTVTIVRFARALEICELAHRRVLLGRAVSAANAQPLFAR